MFGVKFMNRYSSENSNGTMAEIGIKILDSNTTTANELHSRLAKLMEEIEVDLQSVTIDEIESSVACKREK